MNKNLKFLFNYLLILTFINVIFFFDLNINIKKICILNQLLIISIKILSILFV